MKLGTYRRLHAAKPVIHVKEQEIERILAQKQLEHAVAYQIEDRPARAGDQAIVDFDGMSEGKMISGGQSRNFPMILGSHTFIEGFEDQIIGKSPGDQFDIHVVFPQGYYIKQLRGKPAVFRTTLKNLFLLDQQPLDDDFAKDFSEYSTIKEWRDHLRDQLACAQEESAYAKLSRDLLSAVIADSDIEIDEALKNELAEESYDDFLYHLEQNHIRLEDYTARIGATEKDIYQKYELDAIRMIQEESVLHAIILKENISVTDSELTDELHALAADEEEDFDLFRDSLDEEDLDSIADQLRMNKAMQLILENAILE